MVIDHPRRNMRPFYRQPRPLQMYRFSSVACHIAYKIYIQIDCWSPSNGFRMPESSYLSIHVAYVRFSLWLEAKGDEKLFRKIVFEHGLMDSAQHNWHRGMWVFGLYSWCLPIVMVGDIKHPHSWRFYSFFIRNSWAVLVWHQRKRQVLISNICGSGLYNNRNINSVCCLHKRSRLHKEIW